MVHVSGGTDIVLVREHSASIFMTESSVINLERHLGDVIGVLELKTPKDFKHHEVRSAVLV